MLRRGESFSEFCTVEGNKQLVGVPEISCKFLVDGLYEASIVETKDGAIKHASFVHVQRTV